MQQSGPTIVETGRCYCGAVTLQISAPPRSVIHCHCGECRRLSGSAFTTWAAFADKAVAVDGAEMLTSFDVTANVRRCFCRVCGSHLYTTDKRYLKLLGVPVGVLQGKLALQPGAHYFVSHRAAWNELNDALPKFGGESGHIPLTLASPHSPFEEPT